jgi:LacI family transcriptional regulator
MPKPIEPTMLDVAQAAGVGVATVDRVINRRAAVRPATAQRVLEAAQRLGFRRTGLIQRRLNETEQHRRLGFLLQSKRTAFYRTLATELTQAARHLPTPVQPLIEHLQDLTPRHVAARLAHMAQQVDAVAVVAADHPSINQAIATLTQTQQVPVFACISDLTGEFTAGYVGVDNRKMGQMAAWMLSRLCPAGSKVALLLGSHRYLCQEQCEISFRAFLRESAPTFTVLETLVSLENTQLAQSAVLELLHQHPDLAGMYVAGGGIEGVIDALRDTPQPQLTTVCHDLSDITRQALLDGVVTAVLSHPLPTLAARLCEAMVQATGAKTPPGRVQTLLPFEVYTSANV